MDNIEKKIQKCKSQCTELSSLLEKCDDDIACTKMNKYKNVYVQSEINEVKNLLDEVMCKVDNICNMLLMDSVESVNFEKLIKEKIQETDATKQFVDKFGPYMVLYQMLNDNYTEVPQEV